MEMTSEAREQEIALMEAHMIGFADAYFAARNPMLDTADRRRVFEAGFKAAWSDRTAAIEAARVEARAKALEPLSELPGMLEAYIHAIKMSGDYGRWHYIPEVEQAIADLRSLAKEAP